MIHLNLPIVVTKAFEYVTHNISKDRLPLCMREEAQKSSDSLKGHSN